MENAAGKPYGAVEQIIRDRAITELIVTQNLPLSFVASKGFEKYSKLVDPQYKIATTERVKNLIDDSFQRMSTILRHKFSKAESISLTADLWTANSHEGYLGITASWTSSDFHLHKLFWHFHNCHTRTLGKRSQTALSAFLNSGQSTTRSSQ